MEGCLALASAQTRLRFRFLKPSRANLCKVVVNVAYRAKSRLAIPCHSGVILQSQSIEGRKTFYHARRRSRLVWILRRFVGVPI